jgi:Domain of unknown function (DUF4384)
MIAKPYTPAALLPRKLLAVCAASLGLASSLALSQANNAPEVLDTNPCKPNIECDFEAIELQVPSIDYANALIESRSKSMASCAVQSAAGCVGSSTNVRVVTVTKVVYKKRSSTTTTIQTNAPAPLAAAPLKPAPVLAAAAVPTQAISFPLAGQPIAAERYNEISFGWRHTNGAPVHRDHKFRNGDVVKLSFESKVPGYLYIVNMDPTGKVIPLFPRLDKGDTSAMTSGTRHIVADFDENPGVERIYAIFTQAPLQKSMEATTVAIHKQFQGGAADTFRAQHASFNHQLEMSPNGITLSSNGESRSKGMNVLATNFESNSSSAKIEALGLMLIDPLTTVNHKMQVMALDLIHISR